jgi:hypothetical protein
MPSFKQCAKTMAAGHYRDQAVRSVQPADRFRGLSHAADPRHSCPFEREREVRVFGRVGMKRLASSPRQVSSSPAPNRTCEFPRIRLSMHGLSHGWPLQRCKGVGRFPELIRSLAEALVHSRVPSVWYA